MKRLTTLVFLCTLVLLPARAHADDGGWWDWLWKWDPKFEGGSAEIHLLCLDGAGQRVLGCEEWFRNVGRLFKGQRPEHRFRVLKRPANPDVQQLEVEKLTSFDSIKHEFDLRVGYHRSIGSRYGKPDPESKGSINVLNPMGMYHYHIASALAVGAGIGYVTIYGEGFKTFSRVIYTPVSVLIYPIPAWKALAIRPEVHYVMGGLAGADFGDTGVTFAHKREWNASIAVGFDLRRIGNFR